MVQAVEISERDMTVSASRSLQLFLPFRFVGCIVVKVVGDWDLDPRLASDRTQHGDGRLEVVDDHASCAEHRHKSPLSHSGHILCTVSGL